MNLTLKTKEELISELDSDGYYYKNVFGNPSFSDKKDVYKAFMEEDGGDDLLKNINFDTLALIWFDHNQKVVAATFLSEMPLMECNGTFYDIFGYQIKSSRKNSFGGIKKCSSVMKTMFALTYYESHEYVTKNNLNIDGILWVISNKSMNKWTKNRKIINDEYHLMFYLTHLIRKEGLNKPAYVLYYPTSKFIDQYSIKS